MDSSHTRAAEKVHLLTNQSPSFAAFSGVTLSTLLENVHMLTNQSPSFAALSGVTLTTLLEKFWPISLYVTDDAIAKLNVTKSFVT